jgi:CHAT domain-containing protein/tetratricopeptide (TPR) repeat protein
MGKYEAAGPLNQKALDIYRKVLGEEHPDTARSYNNLAETLRAQGQPAAAAPVYQKALDIYRKVLGEEHRDTALSYNNLARNLNDQGQFAAAAPLFQKALDIRRKVLGEEHPDTAISYNNLAYNLKAQGQYAAAAPLFHKALDINRKVLGEEHPETATCWDNLARNIDAWARDWNLQGQYASMAPVYQKALDIRRKVLGEEHPDTARGYNNLAVNLYDQGQFAAAAPLYEKALDIFRKVHGEDPDTATCYNNLAATLNAQGKYAEAEQNWAKGAEIFAKVRLQTAATGLERVTVTSEHSPLPRLAAVLARNGKPTLAWERFEQSIGRGSWDDMSARLRRDPAELAKQNELVAQLNRVDLLIQQTIKPQDTPELQKQREALLGRRRELGDKLAQLAADLEKKYGPVAGQVFDRSTIQKALPADSALVGWIDIAGEPKAADPNGEHWAFLLRSTGEPIVVRLSGSGDKGAWIDDDWNLPSQLRRAMQDPRSDWRPLAQRLRAQRIDPLAKHLKGIRRLIVLPSSALAGVPIEVMADGHTVSYALSGTLFAYLRQQPLPAGGMLVLADPVFDRPGAKKPELPPLPPGGLLLTIVTPNGNAANARLQAGDVLLEYAGTELKTTADLNKLVQAHAGDKEIPVSVWRDGGKDDRMVGPGNLGIVLANDPAPIALAEKRKTDEMLARLRSGDDDGQWGQLPGTRVEAEALRRLCDKAKMPYRLLADSDASEQELDALAASKDLGKYRFIHLATHGALDNRFPLRSAVILSRDHLPDALKQTRAGKPVYDGRMTAEKVLATWHLDAELVTLSACQTALGKYEHGEGFVGFSQALLLSGSRNVCLSLWKVDDTATALLMDRFYENLLTGRAGRVSDRSKVAALEEAKAWLRKLSADEVTQRAASLTNGVARGKGRPASPLLPDATAKPASNAAEPFAHPFYWAAFVLVGDGE